jgi:hypothetical protein
VGLLCNKAEVTENGAHLFEMFLSQNEPFVGGYCVTKQRLQKVGPICLKCSCHKMSPLWRVTVQHKTEVTENGTHLFEMFLSQNEPFVGGYYATKQR